MKKLVFSILMLAALVLIIPSCKKGDIGDSGPTGARGNAGAAGAAGPGGAPGVIGGNNAIYSPWRSVTFAEANGSIYAGMNSPEITQDILDKGIILTYFKRTDSSEAIKLPINHAPFGQIITLWYYVGLTDIYTNVDPGTRYRFRNIVIPGITATSRTSSSATLYTKEKLASMSYEQVKALYNIKD